MKNLFLLAEQETDIEQKTIITEDNEKSVDGLLRSVARYRGDCTGE